MKLSQEALGAAGGVKREAQNRYESGERCPDGNYFAGIAHIGADIAYILTGVRAAPPLAPPPTVEEPAGDYGPDPLARRKAAIKTMVDMLDDPAKLAGFQAALEELERVKRLEQRLEELERKAG